MALTREGSIQIAAVLNAMKGTKPYADFNEIVTQISQLSINCRRHLFAATGDDSMLQLALRERDGLYLAYMLEQHANDPSLPLDVDLIVRYTRDHRDSNGFCWSTQPMLLAAFEKKVNVVGLLLAHGVDVNDTMISYTPLHACLCVPNRSADTLRIAEMFMEHGASLTYANNKSSINRGVTPLMLAASNHPQLVNVILERLRAAGHDVSKYVQACDSRGRTALHYATGGNRYARLGRVNVDVVTSLCKEGADLYARDNDGRDAFMSSCYWLNEKSSSINLTPGQVWSRINYWIGVFQPSLVKQWQVWELVGAQAALDLNVSGQQAQYIDEEEAGVDNQNSESEEPNDTDRITFYVQALIARQLLSPEDIPPIPVTPLFATYVEPVTVEALQQIRDDRSLMLQHAVQVRRRHLGDNSLAVSAALNKYASYLKNFGSAQRAYECRILALRSRPSIKELLRNTAAEEQQLRAYLACFENHLQSAFWYLDEIYNSQRQLRETPVPDTVWDDAMVVFQAAVDEAVLTSMTQGRYGLDLFIDVLILVTRCLGPFNDKRTADLQRVLNGLVIANSDDKFLSRHQIIFFDLFNEVIHAIVEHDTDNNSDDPENEGVDNIAEHVDDENSSDSEDEAENDFAEPVDDGDADSEHDFEQDNWEEFFCKHLTPDGVVFVARAARHGGVSLDPPRNSGTEALLAPLFVCAQLLTKPYWPITEKSKNDLRRVMELLVEEGGAHWDAADDTHNTAVCHFDSVTVSRYMNLQCLAARVVSAQVTDYDVYLPPSLVNFVKLH